MTFIDLNEVKGLKALLIFAAINNSGTINVCGVRGAPNSSGALSIVIQTVHFFLKCT